MKIITKGHEYELKNLAKGSQKLNFVQKIPSGRVAKIQVSQYAPCEAHMIAKENLREFFRDNTGRHDR